MDVLKGEKQTLSEANTTQINPLLTSLKDEIKGFREKVEQAQTESLVGRTQLSAELEQLKGLNERLSADAESLANALTRDTSEQGHWGELVLLDILEDCGLKRGFTIHTNRHSLLTGKTVCAKSGKERTSSSNSPRAGRSSSTPK